MIQTSESLLFWKIINKKISIAPLPSLTNLTIIERIHTGIQKENSLGLIIFFKRLVKILHSPRSRQRAGLNFCNFFWLYLANQKIIQSIILFYVVALDFEKKKMINILKWASFYSKSTIINHYYYLRLLTFSSPEACLMIIVQKVQINIIFTNIEYPYRTIANI